MIMFKFKSKIGFANPKSKSLKVGLPKQIAEFLEVAPGDTMEWIVETAEDNSIKIVVSKHKE